MKKIVFLLVFIGVCLNAKYLGGLAAVVENEPITDYEVSQVMAKLNVNPTQALNILIRSKLEDAQIKVQNIEVSDYDVDKQIEAVASANSMSKNEFERTLINRGANLSEFKEDIRKNIQKEKLYSRIINTPNQNINRDNAIRFYNANKAMFQTFESAAVSKYSSHDKNALEAIINNPMSVQEGVSVENETLYFSQIDKELAYVLLNTPNGSFTPIFKSGASEFGMFYVTSKSGSYVPEFELVEQQVVKAMINQEREAVIADYFNKLRVKANVEIIKR